MTMLLPQTDLGWHWPRAWSWACAASGAVIRHRCCNRYRYLPILPPTLSLLTLPLPCWHGKVVSFDGQTWLIFYAISAQLSCSVRPSAIWKSISIICPILLRGVAKDFPWKSWSMQLIGVLPFGLTALLVKSPDIWPLAKEVLLRVQQTSFPRMSRAVPSQFWGWFKAQILTGHRTGRWHCRAAVRVALLLWHLLDHLLHDVVHLDYLCESQKSQHFSRVQID